MIDTGELLTLAEISVAFAGFSALVTVLGTRDAEGDPRLDSFGLRSLVEVSLVVAAFSLFPLIPHKLAVSEPMVWRISGAGYLVVQLVGSISSWRRFRPLRHLRTSGDRVTERVVWPFVLTSYAALLTVSLGPYPAANSALYFTALFSNLLIAGLLFMRVASSVLASPRE